MNQKSLLGLACAGVCALTGAAGAQGVPQLYNPGFEIPFPGFPTFAEGWRHYQAGRCVRREIGDGLLPATQVHSGTASILMPGGEGIIPGEFMGILSEEFVPGTMPIARNWPEYTFDLVNGAPIEVGFWFMIPAEDPIVGQRAGLEVRFLRSGGNFSFYYRSEVLDIDPDPASVLPLPAGCVRVTTPAGPGVHTNGQWLHYTRTFSQQTDFPVAEEPPTNPARAALMALRFGDVNSTGSFWVDDFSFEQVETPSCPQDYNGVNGVTVQDIYDFLADWSAGLPAADYNGENGVTVQDIYDFLSDWSTGDC